MDLVTLENRELKKHTGAVHITGALTGLQMKISNVFLFNAYDDLLKKRQHHIAINDLAEAIGYNSNDYDSLKEAITGLISMVLEWNILDDRGQEDWEAMSILSSARFYGGICTYEYPERLRLKLYNPETFARISLSRSSTPCSENDWFYRRLQRQQPALALQEGGFGGGFNGFGSGVAQVRRQRDAKRLEELASRASGRGSQDEALCRPARLPLPGGGRVVESMLEAGLIRTTLGATATDALKKDYRHKQAPRERALAERKQAAQAERTEQRQAAEAEERKEALRMEFEARLIDEAIAGLSDTDRRRLEEEFVAGLNNREIPGALVVLESYRKSGFESAGVRGAFRAFQRQQLLKNRKHDAEAFQRFAQEREVQSVGQEVAKT